MSFEAKQRWGARLAAMADDKIAQASPRVDNAPFRAKQKWGARLASVADDMAMRGLQQQGEAKQFAGAPVAPAMPEGLPKAMPDTYGNYDSASLAAKPLNLGTVLPPGSDPVARAATTAMNWVGKHVDRMDRREPSLEDVEISGSQTASTTPVAGVTGGGSRAIPTTGVVDTSEGPYSKMSSGGLTSVTGPSGSMSYEGPARGGGSFEVERRERGGLTDAQWESMNQDERTAVRVKAIRDGMAQQAGPAQAAVARADRPSPGYPGGVSPYERRMAAKREKFDRASREDDRRRAMKNFIANQSGGSSKMRNAAMAAASRMYGVDRVAEEKAADRAVEVAQLGQPVQPDMGDRIAMARLEQDQGNAAFNQQAKLAELMQGQDEMAYEREQDRFSNQLRTAKNQREMVAMANEGVEQVITTGTLPPDFNEVLYRYGYQGISPQMVASTIESQLNEEDRRVLESGDLALRKQLVDQINAALQEKFGQ